MTKWTELKDKDNMEKINFWANQYDKLTEGNKMIALVSGNR